MAEQDVYREGKKSEQEGSQIPTQASDPKEETKTSTASGEKITVKIGKNYDSFNNTIAEIENMAKYPERGHESFMINKRTNSAIAIRQNGQINMSASMYSQYKLNPSGKTVEQSLESVAITNRRKVRADDIVINEHKLNPYLYELTDMKKLETAHNDHMLVGNFCIYGSVLVKAWEVNLHRYVLLRRPARIPMFSPLLNVPEIHKGLGVTDPLKVDETIMAKSNKGYQVNRVYTDSASIIGKEGFDRFGDNRNPQLAVSAESAGIGSDGRIIMGGGSLNTNVTISSGDMKSLWDSLKKMGFNDIAAAGLLGCFSGESSGKFDALEGYYLNYDIAQRVKASKNRDMYADWAYQYLSDLVSSNPSGYDGGDGHGPMPGIGLAQWTGPRGVRLFNMSGGEWWTPQAQIKFVTDELNGSYSSAFNKAQSCGSPEEAAKVFAVDYEGGGFTGYADDRATRAREIYNQFSGK